MIIALSLTSWVMLITAVMVLVAAVLTLSLVVCVQTFLLIQTQLELMEAESLIVTSRVRLAQPVSGVRLRVL